MALRLFVVILFDNSKKLTVISIHMQAIQFHALLGSQFSTFSKEISYPIGRGVVEKG